ncbi:MAG: hypothetical protein N3B01_06685 [Verrucomicrobiae bacterium]|nr:hypothetical protein [Verrucomicrobiae bacterium]
MSTPNPDNQALPLDELNIVPEWIKSPPPSYHDHPGEGPEKRRVRQARQRRPRARSEKTAEQKPPRKPHAAAQAERRPPAPAPVAVTFLPEEKGLVAMIEIMKRSPRAYALFDIAKLILNKPERHWVKLAMKPQADGSRAPLFVVQTDHAVFPAHSEALQHLFSHHFESLCRTERKPCDPPKGNFTCIHKCGITGEIFGPPNYHEYQATLVRFHQRRLRHMPFEEFRARIQTIKDEAAVKQWIESKSFLTEHYCKLCAEPEPLLSREEMENHLTATHMDILISSGTEVQIPGTAARRQPWDALAEALRIAWITEWRFPLRTAQVLSERLRAEGFHFFKHHKGVTYISRIKPRRVENLDGLSDHIQRIITFLRANPNSVRKQLAEHLQITDTERFLADLRWLIEEGYVVEFADGRLWAMENRPAGDSKPAGQAAQPVAHAPSSQSHQRTEPAPTEQSSLTEPPTVDQPQPPPQPPESSAQPASLPDPPPEQTTLPA